MIGGAPWTSTIGGPDPLVQYAIWVPSGDATLVLIPRVGISARSCLLLVSVPDSSPQPGIAWVDLPTFQDRRVWLITKAPHRYPGGRGLQPGHEPVCSDLTDPCQHTMRLSLQRKPCTAKAESDHHRHRRWVRDSRPWTGTPGSHAQPVTTEVGGVLLASWTRMSWKPASSSQARYESSPYTPPLLVRVISPAA
jgi:hypothetical protein